MSDRGAPLVSRGSDMKQTPKRQLRRSPCGAQKCQDSECVLVTISPERWMEASGGAEDLKKRARKEVRGVVLHAGLMKKK
mmetsp:Transcript_120049/g.325780  ORF Transcript_120049/g.325780 Transcript_120049/m.325780 type:complete len:80 (+) Transcript_120049:155-394(+)